MSQSPKSELPEQKPTSVSESMSPVKIDRDSIDDNMRTIEEPNQVGRWDLPSIALTVTVLGDEKLLVKAFR